MFKQSPSRNNRSKGIKVKHILQICVLLAVCIWLIYQLKHSHEKRKEFEVKDDNLVGKVQSVSDNQRIGRKDIPKITQIDTDGEKHEEDEDEKDGEEEENKHEEDETESEDVRIVEREEERGGGDDEIDEHEPEKTETEPEHEEEGEDEDKEREDKEDFTVENHDENEDSDDAHEGNLEKEDNEETAEKEGHTESEENGDVGKDHSEKEVASDDQDHDVGRTNTREAQEVLYRADDASSEVAHNVQSVTSETENVTSGHGNEMWGKINFGQEHENSTSDNAEELIKSKIQLREDLNIGTSNATVTEPKNYKVNLEKPDDNSLQNSTLPGLSSNITVVGGEQSATSHSNETQTTIDSNVSQNGTVELPGDKELKLPGNASEQDVKIELATDDKSRQEASADANKAEDVNINNGESLSSDNSTISTFHDTTNDTAKDSSVDNINQGDKSENSEEAASDETSESHSDKVAGGIQHDPIDASDTTALMHEDQESKTEFDTLPEIRNEIQNTEVVAE